MEENSPAKNAKWAHRIRAMRAGVLYFAMVFVIGFLLGIIRVAFVVPRAGARVAELLELPIMIAASFFSARWLIGKLAVSADLVSRTAMGAAALILMLAAEAGIGWWLQGITVREYFASRDPVSAAFYYLALLVFALLPLIVRRSL
jgi:hypothetical protein